MYFIMLRKGPNQDNWTANLLLRSYIVLFEVTRVVTQL